ncbi:hypothetical protein GW915_07685 [bacterium]|nr:hypothetical protein [bacterium]
MKTAKEFEARLISALLANAEYKELLLAIEGLQSNFRKVLRVNPLKRDVLPELFQEQLKQLQPLENVVDAYSYTDKESVEHLELWQAAGLCFLQEPSAVEVASHALLEEPGLIVDLCAAPGAKSTFIGERLLPGVHLLSNDINQKRAHKLSALMSRQGVENASIWSLPPKMLAEEVAGLASLVLVDAPCSSESFFAKRKEKRADVRDSDVQNFARMQFEALEAAYRMMQPGARLIYSTCTYNQIENEDQVESFIERHDDLEIVLQQRRWPHLDGVPGGYFCILQRSGVLAELPLEGFFALKNLKQKQGFIRNSLFDWRGEEDLYHKSMSSQWAGRSCDLNEQQAQSFIRGESVSIDLAKEYLSQPVRVTWQNLAIGVGKAVAGRINNLIPKTLRF